MAATMMSLWLRFVEPYTLACEVLSFQIDALSKALKLLFLDMFILGPTSREDTFIRTKSICKKQCRGI